MGTFVFMIPASKERGTGTWFSGGVVFSGASMVHPKRKRNDMRKTFLTIPETGTYTIKLQTACTGGTGSPVGQCSTEGNATQFGKGQGDQMGGSRNGGGQT